MNDTPVTRKGRWARFVERNEKSNGYYFQKVAGSAVYKFFRAVMLVGLCFVILQPLFNKVSISFMSEQDLYDSTVINIPRNFTTDNYKLVNEFMQYGKALLETTWISILVSVLQVISCTLVGYGFARFKFPLKKLWFACVIVAIVVPPQTYMTSIYLNFRFFDIFGIFQAITGDSINMINKTLPYMLLVSTCMGLKSSLYIFLIRQFFRGVPKELEEAAYLDGCGNFQTFFRIMVPTAKSILVSCFLFSFVWQWTDAFYSNMFLRHKTLITSSLTSISGRLGDYWIKIHGTGAIPSVAYSQAMIATGVLMAIIPLLVIYLIAQKGFVESISQSGLK